MSNDLVAIPDKEEPHIGHDEFLNTSGQGTFAKVRLTQLILTRTEVAIKVINWRGSSRLFQAVHCKKGLNHPNIIMLFEVIATEETLFLIMETVSGGNMFDYL